MSLKIPLKHLRSFLFLGRRFKNFRQQKYLRAIDIGCVEFIYSFESGKQQVSMKKVL